MKINNIYKKQIPNRGRIKNNDKFEGLSIEKEMEQAMSTNQPISKASISNIFYTQRKDGALAECNIRTDRFDMAQNAMNHANNKFREKIAENLKSKEQQNAE